MSSQNQTPAVPLEQAGGNIASPPCPWGGEWQPWAPLTCVPVCGGNTRPNISDLTGGDQPYSHQLSRLSAAFSDIQYKDIKIMCVNTGVAEKQQELELHLKINRLNEII